MKGNSAPGKQGVCYWTLALLWGFYPHKDSCAQDSTVLAQKQKYRSMEQDRKPRDKLTHIWSPYL